MQEELEDYAHFDESWCLEEDEGLSSVEAILRHARSDPSQQLAYIKGIGAASLHASESELLSLAELCIHLLSSASSSANDADKREMILSTWQEVAEVGRAWPTNKSDALMSTKEALLNLSSDALIKAAKEGEDQEEHVDAILAAIQSLLATDPKREEKAF